MEQYERVYLYQRIVKAKLFIDEHYAEHINLSNISDQAHFSKFHFIRLFKSIYGSTPNNYLIRIRMENAKILLTKGNSVLATCILVGFDSPTSFARMFKKNTGQTPSAFQKEQEEKSLAIRSNPLIFVPNCFAETSGWKNSNFGEVGKKHNTHL